MLMYFILFLNFESLMILGFMALILNLLNNWNKILNMLLCLELFSMLMIFCAIVMKLSMFSFPLIFLIFVLAVSEASIGLSLLLNYFRMHETSFLN